MPCLLAVTLAACQDPGFVCTDESLPAVEVEVRDAVSGEHLSVTPRGVVRDGAFEGSLRVGADERAGTYIVQLEARDISPGIRRALWSLGMRVTCRRPASPPTWSP
jgi:hypothetical protein